MSDSIRRATIDDIEKVSTLQHSFIGEHQLYDHHYYALKPNSQILWKEWLHHKILDDDFALYVAEQEKLTGYVMGWIEQRPPIYQENTIGFLSNLYVLPEARRYNIGRTLVHALFDWFRQKNVTHTELSVDLRNEIAVTFWKRVGYEPTIQRMRMPL